MHWILHVAKKKKARRSAKKGLSDRERSDSALIHVLSFLNFGLAPLGYVVPLALWLINKDDSAYVRNQGRAWANARISYLLYYMVFGVLSFVVIGIPFLLATFVLDVVQTIKQAFRAKDGRPVTNYAMVIRFFEVKR
jgi:uncharacterized protein